MERVVVVLVVAGGFAAGCSTKDKPAARAEVAEDKEARSELERANIKVRERELERTGMRRVKELFTENIASMSEVLRCGKSEKEKCCDYLALTPLESRKTVSELLEDHAHRLAPNEALPVGLTDERTKLDDAIARFSSVVQKESKSDTISTCYEIRAHLAAIEANQAAWAEWQESSTRTSRLRRPPPRTRRSGSRCLRPADDDPEEVDTSLICSDPR